MVDADREVADLSKHTDDELREGIRKADEQHQRLQSEGDDDAIAANRRQRQALQDELDSRT